MFTLNAISYAITLQLSILQIDIALFSKYISELAAIPTIYILLKDKVSDDSKPEKEIPFLIV